jgi:hypothetical protein
MEDSASNIALGTMMQVFCLLLVLLSFFAVAYSCHKAGNWFLTAGNPPPAGLGVLVLLFQSVGMLALFLYDFGRVGGLKESQAAIPRIISYISPDALFIIYYTHARATRFPFVNSIAYVISSALRGWSGFIVILFFIETYYLLKRTPTKHALAWVGGLLVLLFAIFPKVNAIRDSIRGAIILSEQNYSEAFETLLTRLQHVAVVEIAAQDRDRIQGFIRDGDLVPFYADNKLGFKLLYRKPGALSVQQYLALKSTLFGPDSDQDIPDETQMWYTHTGIAGWFFMLPYYKKPLFILFVLAIQLFPYWLLSKTIGSKSMVPALHCAAIVYVFHGWFGPQILFCLTAVVYAGLFLLLNAVSGQRKPNVPFLPASRALPC